MSSKVIFDSDGLRCSCGNDVEYCIAFSDCNRKNYGVKHTSFAWWRCKATMLDIAICNNEKLENRIRINLNLYTNKYNELVDKINKTLEWARRGNLDIVTDRNFKRTNCLGLIEDEEEIECDYGEDYCEPHGDYDMMCEEHRREYGENIADSRNDLD